MTDKELGEILKKITILIDTREKVNQHIINYLEENNIKYKIQKLDCGDYSVEFPSEYAYLNECVIVERKNGLSEIAGNFTRGRERFKREFERMKDCHKKGFLVVENATWKKVVNGSYRSEMSPNSMTASFITFGIKYDIPVMFCGKDESPMLIYKLLYYYAKHKLLGGL